MLLSSEPWSLVRKTSPLAQYQVRSIATSNGSLRRSTRMRTGLLREGTDNASILPGEEPQVSLNNGPD
jgi:hypothetical protein